MSSMTIDAAIRRVNDVYPYLKPVSYINFRNLFVFQMAKSDGSQIHFDNLIAVDQPSGMTFIFNPLKFGKEYAEAARNFTKI